MTSIADTSYEGWTVARAARAAGLRARVYLEVFGLDDAELPKTMARLEERLTALQDECERAARRPAAPPGARDGVRLLGNEMGHPSPLRCRSRGSRPTPRIPSRPGYIGKWRVSPAARVCGWPRTWPSRRQR